MLGICDKIVPGLIIGALRFGHLPVIFVPGRPDDLRRPQRREGPVRALYAEGKAAATELLDGEMSPTTAPAPAPSTAPPTPTR